MGADSTIYVKDLRIFHQIDLKDIIIIDNSILSFAFHIENGIPILPYYENKDDIELRVLVNYLRFLVNAPDIRTENKKFIKYNDIEENSSSQFHSNSNSNKHPTESDEDSINISNLLSCNESLSEDEINHHNRDDATNFLNVSQLRKSFNDFKLNFV